MQVLFWVLGLVNAGNGVWMLLSPESWYHELPAGVPDTGPLNLHFVRDVGAAFATIGVAFLAAAPRPSARRGVLLGATLFLALHAAVHVTDLLAGRLPAAHWLQDLPLVFVPPLVLAVFCLPMLRPVVEAR
jgi:predicted anti-sigma-YlaC factor YlaD